MRVSLISTQKGGGAGIAALRLHRALVKHSEITSTFCSLDPLGPLDTGGFTIRKLYPRFYARALQRLGIATNELYRDQRDSKKFALGEFPFTYPRSDIRLIDAVAPTNPDLIHLHWVSGLLDWETFFPKAPYPIIWTLHDMNAFLGGFHYTCDRDQSLAPALGEESRIIQWKQDVLQNVKNLTVVTPSHWLAEEARNSKLLGQFNVTCIPNGIDTSIFRPFPREFARSLFGLNPDAPLLLTAAENLSSYRKGADLLRHALESEPLGQDWEIITAGMGSLELPPYQVTNVGPIADERLMALLYSAADLVVVPTRQDNLPNVVIESLVCGTPVVATNVGGVPEMIQPGINGILTESLTPESLAEAIATAALTNFDSKRIHEEAVAAFDLSITANRYTELYKECQNKSAS